MDTWKTCNQLDDESRSKSHRPNIKRAPIANVCSSRGGRELRVLAYGRVIIDVTSLKQPVQLKAFSLQICVFLHPFGKHQLVNTGWDVHEGNILGKTANIAIFSP